MKIVIDTREQTPLCFDRFPGVAIMRGTLATGDYSVEGLEDLVALERKSLDDLVGCLKGTERDRFERELARGRGLEFFAVLVEGTPGQVDAGDYRSRMHVNSVKGSVDTFMVRYRVPFIWCGTPERAADKAYSLLSRYVKEVEARYKRALCA